MKSILAITMAAVFASLSLSGTSVAQPANPPTPTTRILAIGTVNPGVDPAAVRQSCRTKSAIVSLNVGTRGLLGADSDYAADEMQLALADKKWRRIT